MTSPSGPKTYLSKKKNKMDSIVSATKEILTDRLKGQFSAVNVEV